jgi:Prealbumin-like fold domain
MSFRVIGPLLRGGVLALATATGAYAADPIPGIDVKLGTNPGGQGIANSTTNDQGVATFGTLPAGSYTVTVPAGANNKGGAKTFTLRAAGPVQVSVKGNGGPGAGTPGRAKATGVIIVINTGGSGGLAAPR